MLKGKHLLEDVKLFEELDDRLAEKVSGGFDIELTAEFDNLTDLADFGLLRTDLLTKIQEEIKTRFPQAGANLALGCTSTRLGVYNCKVSTKGKTESFVVKLDDK